MLGKLQPRFHLLGEAVWDAHQLEASAEPNTVRVSEDVQALLADFLPSLIQVQRDKLGPEDRALSDGALADPDANVGLHRRKKRSSKAKDGRGHKESSRSAGSKESKESKENVKGSRGSLGGKSVSSTDSRPSQRDSVVDSVVAGSVLSSV